MAAYYNEHDAKTALWLRALIAERLIADGEVDTRSILDVCPADLAGFTQCHWFAGIGGWSLALRLAGWPDDRPIWTGSCPCQPFSSAGAGSGALDERHLWPAWFDLIERCQPPIIFGEQVESAIGFGWLDLVHDDLEGISYAVAPVGLPAASVGAFHLRQRLYFVADACESERRWWTTEGREAGILLHAPERGGAGDLAVSSRERREGKRLRVLAGEPRQASPEVGGLADSPRGGQRIDRRASWDAGHVDERKSVGFWSAVDWIPCRDGKSRPVEPGTFPLAHGVPFRVVKLRGYGNAIVPQQAAEVIAAYMEIER